MSKYAEAIGILEFEIKNIEFKLKPKQGDFKKLLKLMSKAKKEDDEVKFMDNFEQYVFDLITREINHNDIEKEELELFIEFNVLEFMKEIFVAFRLSTRDNFENKQQELIEKTKN